MAVVDILSAKRRKKQVSQSKLGKHLGVPKQTVSRWECHQTRLPVDIAFKWAEYLDISLNELRTLNEHV